MVSTINQRTERPIYGAAITEKNKQQPNQSRIEKLNSRNKVLHVHFRKLTILAKY
jgi:hypothetical protein